MTITISKEDALRTLAAMREDALRRVEQAEDLTTAHAAFCYHAGEIDIMRLLGILTDDEHAALYAEWFQHKPGRSATHE